MDPLPTLTLAELYVRQGLIGRARDMYLRIAEAGTDEQRSEARRKLSQLTPAAKREIDLLRVLIDRVKTRRR